MLVVKYLLTAIHTFAFSYVMLLFRADRISRYQSFSHFNTTRTVERFSQWQKSKAMYVGKYYTSVVILWHKYKSSWIITTSIYYYRLQEIGTLIHYWWMFAWINAERKTNRWDYHMMKYIYVVSPDNLLHRGDTMKTFASIIELATKLNQFLDVLS